MRKAILMGGLLLLWACGTDPMPEGPKWRIVATDEEGRGLPSVPLVLKRGDSLLRLRTDPSGMVSLDNERWLEWDWDVVSLDGCPAQRVKNVASGQDEISTVVLLDNLRQACLDTMRLRVVGPAGRGLRWVVPGKLWLPGTPSPIWWTEDSDSTLLDAQGQGRLRFSGLLSPFREQATIKFQWIGDTGTPRWWIDPSDSVLHVGP